MIVLDFIILHQYKFLICAMPVTRVEHVEVLQLLAVPGGIDNPIVPNHLRRVRNRRAWLIT